MSLPPDFVENLKFVHPRQIAELIRSRDRAECSPEPGARWVLKNEVRPSDLYCYLGGRFGQPNGFQNFLRQDDSSNLIHWEWFLEHEKGHLTIQGMNFRTEVWISGMGQLGETARGQFLQQMKTSFAKHGKEMGHVRKALEHWIEFVNPYQRLRCAVSQLHDEITALNLNAQSDTIPDISEAHGPGDFKEAWNEQSQKYSRAIGLCFGIRSMIPVMGEAFVNLLLYMLLKPEIRKDERLRENVIRQPIDIRIKSLSLHCNGFGTTVDYSAEPCKRFHALINERNDLLHGNVAIEKLRFNELYFFGTVPIFLEYSSMWDRSLGVAYRSVGLTEVDKELKIVDDFIEYLLGCLEDSTCEMVKKITEKFDLGLNLDTGRLGILFPDVLVDIVPKFENGDVDGSNF